MQCIRLGSAQCEPLVPELVDELPAPFDPLLDIQTGTLLLRNSELCRLLPPTMQWLTRGARCGGHHDLPFPQQLLM